MGKGLLGSKLGIGSANEIVRVISLSVSAHAPMMDLKEDVFIVVLLRRWVRVTLS